ncbi:probable VCX1-Vacuolar Ca++/H+ exchanger [Serendipita indica DSM 11827]|uniref:Probable VCX1-Vacuolar Ca++/H+ exchanger n=1 Tax=Serendipita indica (strain DSM 11827) TaxID=1109443 RepID=G4TEZ6_SERID|nr:probable VCX1-Vacuolar Ca++/H+ exchanger [Serendipita indica DSM 11827]
MDSNASTARIRQGNGTTDDAEKPNTDPNQLTKTRRFKEFHRRVRGKHVEHVPTLKESLIATTFVTKINLALIFVVLSWVSHYLHWDSRATFVLSFLALIPLEKLLQFCSKQSMLYLGHSIGDLVNVTLMNAVEAILAILLLKRDCKLKLLQGTIIGVIILQLLLVPGVAFVAGGSRRMQQELHASHTQLNQSMMTMGVMCLVIPSAFFAGITPIGATSPEQVVTDEVRSTILKFSRGMAIIMLLVYIASRIYAINPPGDENAGDFYADHGGHEAFKEEEDRLKKEQPKVSPWFCFGLLVFLVVIIGFTAEWLVHSIESVREGANIQEEWFGLILIPIVSFSGDGLVTFTYLVRKTIFHNGEAPHALADAQPIDLAIQFTLFWTPLFVLIGWWIGKPLPLLFDIFEVVILLAAVFVVNYIVNDAKTNWSEGFTMICLYIVIALVAWFYDGQAFFETFFGCVGHVVHAAVTGEAGNSTTTAGSSGGGH